MLPKSDLIVLIIVIFLTVLLTTLFNYVIKRKNKQQLDKIFLIIFLLLIVFTLDVALQLICVDIFGVNPVYFEYPAYISICYLPVALLLMALIFARTKIKFKKRYILLFIIPTLSNLLLWTNSFHHLFYIKYSIDASEIIYGKYFNIHYTYTILLFAISLFILVKYSIKNSGFFSKQAILIFIGILIPIVTNILAFVEVIPKSAFITPITIAFTVIFFALAMFRFNLFKVAPIALQRIVDRISDSYVVLNDNYEMSDFNETFVNTFKVKNSSDLRGKHFASFLNENGLKNKIEEFAKHIEKIDNSDKTEAFELYVEQIHKTFNVEITSIIVNRQFLGILVLFKDITQHINDMQSLKDNQSMLMEKERLATLGQMIGGVAHNLKTPIMSIAGAVEGLSDLINEYDSSIDDPTVNSQDHHEIAGDMRNWIVKIKEYTEYMSDIITAVKGQTVALSEVEDISFDIDELVKRVDILMKHELKNAIAYLNIDMKIPSTTQIHGDINNLVQVINNMISNAIQAYDKESEKNIDLIIDKKDNNLIISVKDYGCGLPEKVQDKLFKEMITTKGKNGTGLGLYMSYSTIKANFNGNITFETKANKGTTFNISIPMN